MIYQNGLTLPIALVAPKALPVTTTLAGTTSAATLESWARAAGQAVLDAGGYPFTPSVVNTQLGDITLYTPPSSQMKFVQSLGHRNGPLVECIYGKAPAHSVFTTVNAQSLYGEFVAGAQCLLIEAGYQVVNAERTSGSKKLGLARVAKLQAHLAEVCSHVASAVVAVSTYIKASESEFLMSVPVGTRAFSQDTVLPDATRDAIVTAMLTNVDGEPVGAEAALRGYAANACGTIVNINTIPNAELTVMQKTEIRNALGTYLAQPTVLLDIIGRVVDSIDPIGYVDILVKLAGNITAEFGEEINFSTQDTPRSLSEILFHAIGASSPRFTDSVEAFYHRGCTPDIVPLENASKLQIFKRVHPSLVDGATFDWTNDRSCNVTFNGVSGVLTYPDWMNRNISFNPAAAGDVAAARAVLIQAHALFDYVYGFLSRNQNGRIAPERLLQIGLPAVTASTFFSVLPK